MDTKFYVDMEDLYGAHNYLPLDVVITKAKGIWVWDVEGKKYLDFLSAYSAVNQGHCHPRIIKALTDQAKKLTLASRAFRNEQWPLLAKELCDLTGYKMALPMNSGSEAVETAVKAARMWAYKKKEIPQDEAEIIVCSNNFHGRTITILSFSTESLYRKDFGPFTPGFVVVPYGEIGALEKAINQNTAAFLVEPIQAESGILFPPEGYLREAKELCEKNNVLFMADEIQTGLGRTGKLFGCDHEEVRPDVLIIGKSLGGGCYAISAVLAEREILELFTPGTHGSTFGANPLACAVAREAIRVIREEKMVENSAEQGIYFLKKLKTIKSKLIKEIRGRGLLIGIELKPEAGGARRFCEALEEEGLLCKETHENVIRFAPPLIIKQKELSWAFKKVKKVFKEIS
ncbi:MAG: ornithine--oxo-acid transaminase [Candidatus Aminicenantes bacterium]|nr:MAG: ornithine--oxo-acid transaminase [Candidatus Aminicenantes bacterium]